MKIYHLILVLGVNLVFIPGCVIVANNGPKPFHPPKDADKVGGGFDIVYMAPEDGTVVLMDNRSGKTIQTVSKNKGETFVFKASDFNRKFFEDMGVDVKKADFVLYFHPKNPKPPVPPQPPLPPQAPQPPQR